MTPLWRVGGHGMTSIASFLGARKLEKFKSVQNGLQLIVMANKNSKSLAQKTKSGFTWLLSGSAVQAMMRVLFTAVLARLLTPADFGLLASAMIVIGFADLFSQMGIGPALVQTKELTEEKVSTAFTFSIGLGIGLVIFFLLINPLITLFFKMPSLLPILNVLVFLFPIRSFTQISFSLLQRKFEFKKLAGLDVISYTIGYGGVGISLAYIGYGVWALVYGVLAQSIIYSILLYWRKPHRLITGLNKNTLKELMAFGKGFTLANFFNYLAIKGDYLVVGKILGAESLGFYSRAYGLMNAPNNIVGKVINTVMFSNFSEIQGDREQLTKTIANSFELLFLFIIPVSGMSWLLAPEIVHVLLGEKWGAVILPFRILTIGMVFRLGYKVGGSFLRGVGRVNMHARIQFIYLFFVLIGSILGSNLYGIIGVAIAIDIALFINFVLLFIQVIKYTNYNWLSFSKVLVMPSILTIGLLVINVLIKDLLNDLEASPFLLLSSLGVFNILIFTGIRYLNII